MWISSSEEGLSVCTMESEKKSDVTSKRRCFNQTSHTYSEKTEHMLVRNVAAGTNRSGFGQAHTAKA